MKTLYTQSQLSELFEAIKAVGDTLQSSGEASGSREYQDTVQHHTEELIRNIGASVARYEQRVRKQRDDLAYNLLDQTYNEYDDTQMYSREQNVNAMNDILATLTPTAEYCHEYYEAMTGKELERPFVNERMGSDVPVMSEDELEKKSAIMVAGASVDANAIIQRLEKSHAKEPITRIISDGWKSGVYGQIERWARMNRIVINNVYLDNNVPSSRRGYVRNAKLADLARACRGALVFGDNTTSKDLRKKLEGVCLVSHG